MTIDQGKTLADVAHFQQLLVAAMIGVNIEAAVGDASVLHLEEDTEDAMPQGV